MPNFHKQSSLNLMKLISETLTLALDTASATIDANDTSSQMVHAISIQSGDSKAGK